MKNIYKYIGLCVAIVYTTSCDPLKDINDQIDDGRPSSNLNYTLSDNDYALSCSEDVQKFKSFSKDVPPGNDTCGVAQILNQKFLGVSGDVLNGTYNYYNPLYKGNTIAYQATQADYDRFGSYSNLNRTQSIAICDSVYTADTGSPATKTAVVSLTANYYTGSHTAADTLIEYISFGSPIWHPIYVLQTDDYVYMNQATNPNFFTSKSNAVYRIPVWLKLYGAPYAEANEIQIIQYTVREYDDDGNKLYKDYLAQFNFDGTNWVNISDTSPATSAFKWSSETNNWAISPVYNFERVEEEATPGLEYTLTSADYSSSGEAYANFDTRNNTQADIDRKIGVILNSQSEINIEEGDKVHVNYAVYPSGSLPNEGVYKANL